MIFNIVEVWRPIFTWQTTALRNGQVVLLMLAILKRFISYSDPIVLDTKYRLCFFTFSVIGLKVEKEFMTISLS